VSAGSCSATRVRLLGELAAEDAASADSCFLPLCRLVNLATRARFLETTAEEEEDDDDDEEEDKAGPSVEEAKRLAR